MDTDVQRERKALADLIDELRVGLISRATGGTTDGERYRQIRKTLLGMPGIGDGLPRFLRTCNTVDDFWSFIQAEFPTYKERRKYLNDALGAITDRLDGIQRAAEANLVLGEVIGRGGFGTVYKVRHSVLEMDFAVKVFDPVFDDGGDANLARFFREARVLLSLNHSHIVRVFDAGYLRNKPFIRMEFLEGKNLNQFLRDHGPLPLTKAVILVRKVTEAIAHAHDVAKVCHRDLKPSNIMVAPGERVSVVDFGLGVFVEQDLVSRITKTGEAVVGGYYTAPELIADPKLVDRRSDIYSVGAIWFTAVTGRPPGGADISGQLKAVSKMTDRYRNAILRALDVPTKRFQSAAEMLTEVQVIEKQWSAEGVAGWLMRE